MATKTRTLAKLLTSPSKVAHALDWKRNSGSLLSLNVSKKFIDITIASHPSTEEPIFRLPSLSLSFEMDKGQKILSRHVVDDLAEVVSANKVCGVVVSWPVQKGGWCGAPCGRVLHTLDLVIAQSNILNHNRPVCLWDQEHRTPSEDEWGRDPQYAMTSSKTVHKASEEHYGDRNCESTEVWTDFYRVHWPEHFHQEQERRKASGIQLSGKQAEKNNVLTFHPSWITDAYDENPGFGQQFAGA